MADSPNKRSDHHELDLVDLLFRVWAGRRLVAGCVAIALVGFTLYDFLSPKRYVAEVPISTGPSWPYFEANRFLTYLLSLGSTGTDRFEPGVSPINELSTMNAFVSYFNRRGALKEAIKNHHEIFETADGTDEELDALAGGISLGYTLVKDRKGNGYRLIYTTSDIERSNLILTSTIDAIGNTIRAEISNTLTTAKRQILLDQTTRRNKLKLLVNQRRQQLMLQHEDHIRKLEEHAALARHLGIEIGFVATGDELASSWQRPLKNFKSGQDIARLLPHYLRGYKVIEEEIRISKARDIRAAIESDFKIFEYRQEIARLNTQSLENSGYTSVNELRIVQREFNPVEINLKDIAYRPKRNSKMLLGIGGIFGLTIGIILTLLMQALRTRKSA